MKKIILLYILSGLGFGAVKAQAPDPDTTARHFIILASIGNLQEIVSGKLAAQKAVDPAVRAFGKQMIADHSKAQAQLMQLVKAKGINIPPQATGEQVAAPMLEKASGEDFDRVYIHMMAPDHRQTVIMFQNYALGGKDRDVKAFAQQTLPTLKQHLAAITAINDKLKNLSVK
jgi:putative membrane protein